MMSAKDDSITSLVARLGALNRAWEPVDHWEADLCAIGIRSSKSPGRLVYVSTYGSNEDRFDYECEIENGAANLGYDVVEEGRNVAFEALAAAIERHLLGPG